MENYGNNGKGWYFQFDDDNEMSYKYIFSITKTWMDQLKSYNPELLSQYHPAQLLLYISEAHFTDKL